MSDDISYDFLHEKLRKTYGSRFNAYRRYKSKHYCSLWTISILSILVFVLSLIFILDFGFDPKIISLFSIMLSVGILVVSLIETSQSYEIKALKMHECAKEIKKLDYDLFIIKELNITPEKKITKYQEILANYKEIIDHCDLNHSFIDYKKFLAEYRKEFDVNWFIALFHRFYYCVHTFRIYFILFLILPAITIITLFLTKP